MIDDLEKCAICGGPYDKDKKYHDDLAWKLHPASMRSCSQDCMRKAVEANGCFKMRNRLKNLQTLPFEMFQEIFEFPEGGGYAKDMYQLARTAPLGFFLRLDNHNFYKLTFARI